MLIFDWLRRQIADAVRLGIADGLESVPRGAAEPSPPNLLVAGEVAPQIAADPQPTANGKARRVTVRA